MPRPRQKSKSVAKRGIATLGPIADAIREVSANRQSPNPTNFYTDPKRPHVPQPYVFVTLNPETNEIQAELHEKGAAIRHVVKLTDIDSLRRVLEWRQDLIKYGRDMVMGEDGNPTEAQIRHWEDHAKRSHTTRLQSNCPFCIAEAKAESNKDGTKARKFDTRGNLIINVTSSAQMGLVRRTPGQAPAAPAAKETK